MLSSLLEREDARLAVAIVIGLLMGAEREQRHAEEASAVDRPGLRTFALVALLGGVSALFGEPWLLGVLAAAVAAGAVARFVRTETSDAGLTTEMALLVAYALGALAIRMPAIALAAGVTATMLLAFRTQLHGAVRERVSRAELRDALVVAAAALVVLPMLPDRPIDPWSALNPFTLWRLVVAAMTITVLARALERVAGARWGPAIAGLASGFVSSSATIAAMGAKAKDDEGAHEAAVMTATGSTVATFLQMSILVGTASPPLLRTVVPALVIGALGSIAYTTWAVFRAAPSERVATEVRGVNLRAAVLFAALVGGVTLLSSAVGAQLGSGGALVTSALAAFADAHAAGASAAALHAAHGLSDDEAAVAVLLGLSTNTATKITMAFASGSRRYGRDVTVGLVLVLALAWGSWLALRAVLAGG